MDSLILKLIYSYFYFQSDKSISRLIKNIFLVILLSSCAGYANSQQVEESKSIDHTRKVYTSAPYETEFEKIDPYSLNLTLSFTDLFVPGNGGLDIVVNRSYDHSPYYVSDSFDEGQTPKPGGIRLTGDRWEIDIPALYWPHEQSYLAAKTSKSDCKQRIALYQLTNGQRELKTFFISSTTDYAAISKDNWKLECLHPSEGTYGRVAYAPDGKRYVYTQPATSVGWFLGRVTDRNGNWLQYNYSTHTTGYKVLSSITANDGRIVNFTYTTISGRPHVAQIQGPVGQTVSYTYEAYTRAASVPAINVSNYDGVPTNRTRLTKVTRADGTSWTFTYAQPATYSDVTLSSITTPSGGIINYSYQPAYVPDHPSSYIPSSKTVSGTLPAAIWSFEHPSSSTGHKTKITGPNYCRELSFLSSSYLYYPGNSTVSAGYFSSIWDKGLNSSDATYSDNTCTTVAQQTERVWSKRQIDSRPYWIWNTNENIFDGLDDRTYAPIETSRKITRDGQIYQTTISSWDTYGNPLVVNETGTNGGNRTTTNTYYLNTTKWILHQTQNESFSGSSITRSFDTNGNLLQFTQDGVATSATYDVQGNVASITYPRNLTHYFSNYKRGKPQTETQPESISVSRVIDDAGNIASETNGEGKTTSYTYDGLRRVATVSKPLGPTQFFSYTATTKSATRGSLTETTQYDGLYRPTSITLGGIATTYSYDVFGQNSFVSNPGSTFGTSYIYDVLGRVKKQINADGTIRNITYGTATKTVTDERGFSTTYNYRSYGNPDQQWVMSIISPDVAANITLARNTKDLVTSAIQGGVTRTYGYNGNYYLASINNPETGLTVIGRDIAGNQISRGTGLSATATYNYDGQNRLTSVTYPSGTPSITNTYNKTGRLLTSNSSIANKTYNYDSNSNLLWEKIDVDSQSFTATYGYNNIDQLSSVTYPRSGNIVSYSPDILGRPTQVSGYISAVSYWPSGQIQQINYANGTITRYEQNSRLWPSKFSTQKGATYYTNSNYGYDGVGNLTSISDSVDSSYNRTIGYDALSRLNSITGPWGSGSIAYSGAGNITNQIFGSYGLYYNYDSNNRLSTLTGNRNATFSYDYYGNVTSDASTTFVYDDAPNLRCANCANTANKVQYGYDAANNRVTVEKGGIKTYEFYDSTGKQLIEFTPEQNKLIEYIYLGGKRVAQRVSP